MLAQEAVDHSATVARHLPYLRRHARALTGNQASGDQYGVAVLESIVADPGCRARIATRRCRSS